MCSANRHIFIKYLIFKMSFLYTKSKMINNKYKVFNIIHYENIYTVVFNEEISIFVLSCSKN